MIVIACNNGWHCAFKSISQSRALNQSEKILVVDTNSTDFEFSNKIKEHCAKNQCIYEKLQYSGYDFSAYIYAIKNFKNEEYFLFHHDSVIQKSQNAILDMSKKSDANSVCAWICYPHNEPNGYDNLCQRNWVFDNFKSTSFDRLIYGPNFFCQSETLYKLVPQIDSIKVLSKIHQQGMERGWAVLFKKNNIKINSLEEHEVTGYKFDNDLFSYFTKITKHTRK